MLNLILLGNTKHQLTVTRSMTGELIDAAEDDEDDEMGSVIRLQLPTTV